jgi:hypothetical protein
MACQYRLCRECREDVRAVQQIQGTLERDLDLDRATLLDVPVDFWGLKILAGRLMALDHSSLTTALSYLVDFWAEMCVAKLTAQERGELLFAIKQESGKFKTEEHSSLGESFAGITAEDEFLQHMAESLHKAELNLGDEIRQ